MQEARFSELNSEDLVPTLFSIPGGFLNIQPRCKIISRLEWESKEIEEEINRISSIHPVENKLDSFGWFCGRLVAVDYGS